MSIDENHHDFGDLWDGVNMTVRELMELNQMITDVDIEIRRDGTRFLDALFIGCASGEKPPFPVKVPESEQYINNLTRRKEAHYVKKSINAWDDGRDYWQSKPDRIPKTWQSLKVFSWEVWPASIFGNPRRRSGKAQSVNFHGQRLRIIALPPEGATVEDLAERMKDKAPEQEQIDGQTNIFDFIPSDGAGRNKASEPGRTV